MDDAGNVTQDGEEDVDAEVGTTAALEEDTNGREEDGKEDLADVAVERRRTLAGKPEKPRVSLAGQISGRGKAAYLAVKAILCDLELAVGIGGSW